jgi:hypothetical protein
VLSRSSEQEKSRDAIRQGVITFRNQNINTHWKEKEVINSDVKTKSLRLVVVSNSMQLPSSYPSQLLISLAFRLQLRASSIGERTFLASSFDLEIALNVSSLNDANATFAPSARIARWTDSALEFRSGGSG